MDNFDALSLAINILNSDDEVIEDLKEGGIDTYTTDDGIAFAYDPDAIETYDDLAENVEPTFKLGVINTNDGRYYEQPQLTQKLADYMSVEPDDIDLTILPDFTDFVDENQNAINGAIKQVQDSYYSINPSQQSSQSSVSVQSSEPASNASNQKQEVHDNLQYDPSTATFSESSTPIGSTQIPNVRANEGLNNVGTASNSTQQNADFNRTNDSVASQLPSFDNDADQFKPKANYLLDLASELFADKDETVALKFDPYTSKQLQGSILEVEKNIANGRGQGVKRIYQRILDNLPEWKSSFNAEFKANTDKHNDTLKTIDANEADALKAARNDHEVKYKDAKEQFIESQRPLLEQKYDADHREDADKALNAQLNAIRTDNEALRHQENRKFDEFKSDQEQAYIKNKVRQSITIDDIMSDYNKLINADMNLLKQKSSEFADQTGVITKKIADKLQEAQSDRDKYRNLYTNLKSNYDKNLNANVEAKTNQNLAIIQEQLKSKNNEVASRSNESETLRDALKSEQEKVHEQQNTIEDLQHKNKRLESTVENLRQDQEQLKNNLINTHQTLQTVGPGKAKQSHLGGKIAGIVVGTVAVIGLSISSTVLFMNHSQNNQPVKTEQTVPSNNASSSVKDTTSSSSQAPSYKKGDTWSYHSNSDNNNYTVTMDNPYTGHYTDKNGQEHTVTLKNNN